MILLDAFIRFSGIGLLALLGGLALRDYRDWQSTPYLVLTCISVSALFLGYAPDLLRPTGLLYAIVRILDVPHLVFVWLFALSLFQSDFRLRPYHWAVGILYCLPIFWLRSVEVTPDHIPLIYLVSAQSLFLMGHLCFVTLRDMKDDLLESRRKSRVYFVLLIAVVTILAAGSELFLLQSSVMSDHTGKILSIWPAIVWGTYWMLSFRPSAVTFGAQKPRSAQNSAALDQDLKQRLDAEMLKNNAFKQRNLTIISLAKTLGVTQHRLRAFINQSLGYPNFNGFVNHYRMEAAKADLADPKQESKPVLAIAMDAGFNSLPSFNRIFKTSEGLTPTAYRRHHLKAST